MSIFKNIETQVKTPHRRGSAGFTLIEVVVAMFILGIVGATLYAGLAQCLNSLRSERHRLRATQILTEKMEVLRLYNWDQIKTSGFVPAAFTEAFDPEAAGSNPGIVYYGTIALTAAPVSPAYTNTMCRVIVSLAWTNGAIAQRLSMETLVSEYGIQNYVY